MSEKTKLIPALRFPEFKDDGEWEEKKISELGESISGLAGKTSNDFGKGEAYITYKQVFDNSIINFDECGRVQIAENENQNILQKGDILFTASSETPNEVGFASVIMESPKEKIYLNSFCFALRPISLKLLQPSFSRYLFHSELYRKAITRLAQGGIRYNISKIAFLDLKIFIPQKDEQICISDCLSSIDELITAESKKLELLKQHKNGLMQNLFPQEGEKVPKVRFPEFKDSGEWEEKPIKEVFNHIGGKALEKHVVINSKYHFISIGNYSLDGEYIDNGKRILFNHDTKKKLLNKNDFVMLLNDKTIKGDIIGSTILIDSDNKYIYNQISERLLLKERQNHKFVWYVLNSRKTKKQILNLIQGGTQIYINYSAIEKIFINIPCDFKEQCCIADCLSSLDELISVQTKKIEQLKLHKKGLMQGLFPKMEE